MQFKPLKIAYTQNRCLAITTGCTRQNSFPHKQPTKERKNRMKTEYAGIDYSLGRSNVNHETGIHYGVIPHNAVGSAWYESSEANYGEPCCPKCGNKPVEYNDEKHGDYLHVHRGYRSCSEFACEHCELHGETSDFMPEEPLSFYVDDGETKAEQSQDSPDIFVLQSPYFTHAQYCSPCAPGACYLLNPCDDGPKAYCLGHDWFEDGKAPYPVYSVETGELIEPEAN